jgi:ankyrin repeat protein
MRELLSDNRMSLASLNTRDSASETGFTALHFACERRGKVDAETQVGAVRILLEAKADVTLRDDDQDTPILLASGTPATGQQANTVIRILELLLDHGANPHDKRPKPGYTVEVYRTPLTNAQNRNVRNFISAAINKQKAPARADLELKAPLKALHPNTLQSPQLAEPAAAAPCQPQQMTAPPTKHTSQAGGTMEPEIVLTPDPHEDEVVPDLWSWNPNNNYHRINDRIINYESWTSLINKWSNFKIKTIGTEYEYRVSTRAK